MSFNGNYVFPHHHHHQFENQPKCIACMRLCLRFSRPRSLIRHVFFFFSIFVMRMLRVFSGVVIGWYRHLISLLCDVSVCCSFVVLHVPCYFPQCSIVNTTVLYLFLFFYFILYVSFHSSGMISHCHLILLFPVAHFSFLCCRIFLKLNLCAANEGEMNINAF